MYHFSNGHQKNRNQNIGQEQESTIFKGSGITDFWNVQERVWVMPVEKSPEQDKEEIGKRKDQPPWNVLPMQFLFRDKHNPIHHKKDGGYGVEQFINE